MKKQLGLHQAAKVGDIKEFKQLVKQLSKKHGAKAARVVDEKDEYYQTPLHIACFEGHLDIVKYLVDKCKANIYARDKNNWTPLHAAATGLTQAHVKVCAFLLDRGAETEAQTNDASTPLHYFVRMDPEDILEFHKVLERMAAPDGKVSARDSQRGSKLVNAQNKHGESALHHAAIKGREQSAIFLHHIGADVNLRNKYGETPLIVAIRSARPEMAKLLLSLGADPSIKSDAGTALELAKSVGLDDIVAELQGGHKPRRRGLTTSALGDDENVGFGFIVGSDTSDGSDDDSSDEVVEVVETEQTGDASYSGPYVSKDTDSKDGLVVFSFHCGACGAVHTEKALNFHAPYPSLWEELTPSQREDSKLSLDLCQINITSDGESGKPKLLKASFFIRVLIEINISDNKELGPFTWGVWALISEEDFKKFVKNWSKEGREKEKPFFGVLQTSLPSYKVDTKGLKARIYTRPVGKRPYAEIFDSSTPPHELTTQQKDGIPTKRLTEILELLHG